MTRTRIVLALLMAAAVLLLCAMPGKTKEKTYRLPVLMYHHFDENVTADTVVSPERFREQMVALKDAGYTTVTLSQIADFIDFGVPLPEKSVLITLDDGYSSNLAVAAPILEELGLCATVFVIGIYEGETISPNSGNPLYPARFSYEDARWWVENGVLDLQSHSYNMHQNAADGWTGRDGILPLKSECQEAYCAALLEDAGAFEQRRAQCEIETPLLALAYPYGFFDSRADEVLRKAGFRFTFTVDEHSNILRVGNETCLWNMGRFNVTERDSGERLLKRLNEA